MTALQHHPRRSVRLDTLVRLRWLAIFGQIAALLVVTDGLDFQLPFWRCLAVVGAYAAFNLFLRLRFRGNERLAPERAAWLLAVDIAELAMLLALTGGLENPFAFLFLGPVLISATALPPRMTLMLAAFAVSCATVLVFVHYPLPWSSDDPLELPPIYMLGVWLSILLAIGYISIYAWQITEEARQLADALVATELVLAREQHLSQLDGLAAAAAHELGTPLSTIALVSKELELALAGTSDPADDARLLPAPGEPFERMKLSALIEDVVSPHRNFGIAIDVHQTQDAHDEPVVARNPAILYGLGNLLENAVDFAHERVDVTAAWSEDTVTVTIIDDGPGFPPEIIGRIGEPYVKGHRPQRMQAASQSAGLGLGFFIAKTLLDRSGGQLAIENRAFPQRGAVIRVTWPRADFERPLSEAA